MTGYLVGPRIGSLGCNVIHPYTLPLAPAAVGVGADNRLVPLLALIWAGLIGADRLVGYGLMFNSGFKGTHLSTQSSPVATLTDSE